MNNQIPPQSQSLIEVKNLSFKRGERIIYDNVSLTIRRGQITAIMGPSGTGKTTLLRLIGGHACVPMVSKSPRVGARPITPNSAATKARAHWW